jgi:hypothetical protein
MSTVPTPRKRVAQACKNCGVKKIKVWDVPHGDRNWGLNGIHELINGSVMAYNRSVQIASIESLTASMGNQNDRIGMLQVHASASMVHSHHNLIPDRSAAPFSNLANNHTTGLEITTMAAHTLVRVLCKQTVPVKGERHRCSRATILHP